MRTLKIFTQMISVCFLLFLATPVCLGEEKSRVELHDGRISIKVEEEPLSQVMELLKEQGVAVQIDPRIDPYITATILNRPVAKGLETLLKPYNYALVWEEIGEGDGQEIRLTEVRIFYKGQKGKINPFQERNNLDVTAGNDGLMFVKSTVLLRIKPGTPEKDLTDLVSSVGGDIIEYHKALGVVRLKVPESTDIEELASRLSGKSTIESAEPDYVYSLPPGLKTISAASDDGEESSDQYRPATGMPIAVLDSGLSKDYVDSSFLLGTFDALTPGADISDNLGHGTQMSLIAAGAVTPVGTTSDSPYTNPVVAVRVFDDNGNTSNATLIRGIDYAISAGARILSMSWGSETASSIMQSAIEYAAENGLILVAAAGNSPTGEPVYPAAYENVIGVGADMPNGEPWEQSNYGDFVAVQAPGLANLPVGHNGEPGTYVGTSISTAYTSREIALTLENDPNLNLDALVETLATDGEK